MPESVRSGKLCEILTTRSVSTRRKIRQVLVGGTRRSGEGRGVVSPVAKGPSANGLLSVRRSRRRPVIGRCSYRPRTLGDELERASVLPGPQIFGASEGTPIKQELSSVYAWSGHGLHVRYLAVGPRTAAHPGLGRRTPGWPRRRSGGSETDRLRIARCGRKRVEVDVERGRIDGKGRSEPFQPLLGMSDTRTDTDPPRCDLLDLASPCRGRRIHRVVRADVRVAGAVYGESGSAEWTAWWPSRQAW